MARRSSERAASRPNFDGYQCGFLDPLDVLFAVQMPVARCALVPPRHEDDPRNGTASGEQGQHGHYQPSRKFEAVERRRALSAKILSQAWQMYVSDNPWGGAPEVICIAALLCG